MRACSTSGYVAFFAAGAYVAGWFASQQFGGGLHSPRSWIFGGTVPSGTLGIHLTPWLVILIAAIFAALLGVLIGLPTLRLRGDYLAIVTLGFGEIIPQFVRNGDHIGGFNLTNGSFGLTGIDGLGLRQRRAQRAAVPAEQLRRAGRLDLVLLDCARAARHRDRARRCCCATRASAAPGSRFARTRTRRLRWAFRSCASRRWPT